MIRGVVALAASLLLPSFAASAAPAEELLQSVRAGDGRRWSLELPSIAQAWALVRHADRAQLYFLIHDTDDANARDRCDSNGPTLARVDLLDAETLRLRRYDGLPVALGALDVVVDADGREALVGYDGATIWKLTVSAEGVSALPLMQIDRLLGSASDFVDPLVGGGFGLTDAAAWHRVDWGPRGWERRERVELPREVGWLGQVERSVAARRITPVLPAASALASAPASRPPARLELQRLRLVDRGTRLESCWLRFPGEEQALDEHWIDVDGTPLLAVQTTPADKRTVLGEKRLRLFDPSPDRSRTGHPPLFNLKTRINLWQDTWVFADDINADGHDDLLLAYWKGRRKLKFVVDHYLAEASRRWADAPRSTTIAIDDAEIPTVRFGADWDGDQQLDLVWVAQDRAQLARGVVDPTGKARLEDEPLQVPLAPESHSRTVEPIEVAALEPDRGRRGRLGVELAPGVRLWPLLVQANDESAPEAKQSVLLQWIHWEATRER